MDFNICHHQNHFQWSISYSNHISGYSYHQEYVGINAWIQKHVVGSISFNFGSLLVSVVKFRFKFVGIGCASQNYKTFNIFK